MVKRHECFTIFMSFLSFITISNYLPFTKIKNRYDAGPVELIDYLIFSSVYDINP